MQQSRKRLCQRRSQMEAPAGHDVKDNGDMCSRRRCIFALGWLFLTARHSVPPGAGACLGTSYECQAGSMGDSKEKASLVLALSGQMGLVTEEQCID